MTSYSSHYTDNQDGETHLIIPPIRTRPHLDATATLKLIRPTQEISTQLRQPLRCGSVIETDDKAGVVDDVQTGGVRAFGGEGGAE